MGKIKNQFNAELKLLPFTLIKFIGGALSVIGFMGASFFLLNDKIQSPSLLLLFSFFVAAIAGVVIFIISSKMLTKRLDENPDLALNAKNKTSTSIIAWLIFFIIILMIISGIAIMNIGL